MIPSFTTIPTDTPRAMDARDVGNEDKVSKPHDGFGQAYNHLAKKEAEARKSDHEAVSAEDKSDVAPSGDEAAGAIDEVGDAELALGEEGQDAQLSEPLILPTADAEIVPETETTVDIASLPLSASQGEESDVLDSVPGLPGQSVRGTTPIPGGVELASNVQGSATALRSGTGTVPVAEALNAATASGGAVAATPAAELSEADVVLAGSVQADARSRSQMLEQPVLETKPVSPQISGQVMKTTASMAALSAVATQAELGMQEVEGLEVELTEGATAELFDGPTDVRLLGRSVVEGTPAPPLIWQSAAQASVLLRTEGDSKFLNAVRHDGSGENLDGLEAVINTQEAVVNNALRSSPSAVATRVDASAVMSQLSAAVQRNGAGQLEVALNPPELGRVRFSMESQDGNMVIAITADKPETMDLIRRHIDQLEKEFLELGYDSLSFNFTTPDGDSGDGTDEERGSRFSGSSASEDMPPVPTHSTPGNGINGLVSNGQIDIRL